MIVTLLVVLLLLALLGGTGYRTTYGYYGYLPALVLLVILVAIVANVVPNIGNFAWDLPFRLLLGLIHPDGFSWAQALHSIRIPLDGVGDSPLVP